MQDPLRQRREISIKKVEADELRPEYRRADSGAMERGKYAVQMREASNVVVLDPDIAEAFPNDQAVNAALRSLLELAKLAARAVPSTTTTYPEAPTG